MKQNLKELQTYLDLGVCDTDLRCYSSGRVEEALLNIADSKVESGDLFQWAKNNIEKVEGQILLLIDTSNPTSFLESAIKDARYEDNVNDIYANLEDILLDYIYNYLIEEKEITEIEENVLDAIVCEINISNANQFLEDIKKIVDDMLEELIEIE